MGHGGNGNIFFSIYPQANEKELFSVIVQEQHFAVPACRLYRLLSPASIPFKEWFRHACTWCLLEEGVDYFPRDKDYALRLYTVKKICTLPMFELDDVPMNDVFHYSHLVHERLLNVSLLYMGDYLAYKLNWHTVGGRHLYKWTDIIRAMQPLPLSKTVEKEKWPQHFTSLNHTDYISHELACDKLLEKWLADNKKFLLGTPPLEPVTQ